MVWGSDWPHTPALRGEMPMPDDAALLGILARSTTEDGLKRVLVANPTTLYGLSPWAS
jgi:predicted TIM-barrel fold metal-dependent hydrolase